MPCPFLGMDPFIESQAWEDFHLTAVVTISEFLNQRLRGHYTSRIERRIYTQHPYDYDPDVVIGNHSLGDNNMTIAESGVTLEPTTCLIAMPQERREAYLVIKKIGDDKTVTIIELLSPPNKRRGTGREEYISKRQKTIGTSTHLIEFDLLRGGMRMPMQSPLPAGDYYTIINNSRKWPCCDVYSWRLQNRLPTIPIPLARNDPDIPLNLQDVVDTLYDRARYDQMLDYTAPLFPPADNQIQHWITQQLAVKSTPPEPPQ